MSIHSTLKKEGISLIGQLNTMEINKIASNVSDKLSKAFPEHHLDKNSIFIAIARLNMYLADMEDPNAQAKYFYKNDSIYFNKNMDFSDINTLSMHECIHFLQSLKNDNGKLLRLGLYNMEGTKDNGMALNEAAVQKMASIACGMKPDNVRYYNMDFITESPDYYPIETALLNEIIFFTGSYPLYNSTLYSNDIFKNTFIAKSNAKTYATIEKNFNVLFEYENKLGREIEKLSKIVDEFNINKIRKINSRIADLKQIIQDKTLETQNIIMVECFYHSLNQVKTLDDVQELETNLLRFKNYLITTQDYTFYDEFSSDMMHRLYEKAQFIEKYGNILQINAVTNELTTVDDTSYGIQFFKNMFKKLKLIVEEKIREKDF